MKHVCQLLVIAGLMVGCGSDGTGEKDGTSQTDQVTGDMRTDAAADLRSDAEQDVPGTPDSVDQEVCTPKCDGKQCGPDGCGGKCGTCVEWEVCLDGVCCETQCKDKDCGPDGCGGNCGGGYYLR